jgi:hypothetical protein
VAMMARDGWRVSANGFHFHLKVLMRIFDEFLGLNKILSCCMVLDSVLQNLTTVSRYFSSIYFLSTFQIKKFSSEISSHQTKQ